MGKMNNTAVQRLINNRMDVSALRTFSILQRDEWIKLDTDVIASASQKLVGIRHLEEKGLYINIPNGMSYTVFESTLESDISPAVLTMDGLSQSDQSVPALASTFLPLPILHRGFSIPSRLLMASRNTGVPIDTSSAKLAARKIAEGLEDMLVNGQFLFGPNAAMYGYLNFPQRQQYTFQHDWTDPATTVADIEEDVLGMRAMARDKMYYGPYCLYYSSDCDMVMQQRVSDLDGTRIRDDIMSISGIDMVEELPAISGTHAILVQMTEDVVRLVKGMDITTVDWEEMGGMNMRFSVMTIQVPQLFADYDGNCGIVVAST